MLADSGRPDRNSPRGRQDDEEALHREVANSAEASNVGGSSSVAPQITSETSVMSEVTLCGLPMNSNEPASGSHAQAGSREASNLELSRKNSVFSHAVRFFNIIRFLVVSLPQHAKNATYEGENENASESGIFLCGGNGQNNQRAVVVPVYGEIPRRLLRPRPDFRPSSERVYRGETDEKIYIRLRYYWNRHFRTWHQYIPFYGITDVRETEFAFEPRIRDGDIAIPVSVKPLDIESIRKIANDHVDSAASFREGSFLSGDPDCNLATGYHCELCRSREDFFLEYTCPLELEQRSKARLRTLGHGHYVKVSFMDPGEANARDTLRGLAQKTCIYRRGKIENRILPEKGSKPTAKLRMRGIYVEVGWDTELMRARLPLIVFVLFSLVLFLRIVSGDWNLALQAGQFLAALVALGVPIAMHMVQER